MLSDYFNFLKKVAIQNPDVLNFRLIKEFIGVSRGFIRFALELRDGTELHIFEYVDSGLHKIDYSYHWQDNEKKLIQRWDNAPHHVEIKTFPHHLHNGEEIIPSAEPTFVEILKKIGERIYKK
jgi:hypothetical protein